MVSMISQNVWNQVYSRLSNVSAGFNAGMTANVANYGLSNFVQINFSLSGSNNFWAGQVDLDDLEKTGIIKYPAACLYTMESANTNLEKFHKFSGPVRIIFEVGMSWANIKGQIPFENYTNCVEDVVLDVVNRIGNQNWASPVVYNGQIQCKRGPISYGAQNFKQRLGFSMMFAVDSIDL